MMLYSVVYIMGMVYAGAVMPPGTTMAKCAEINKQYFEMIADVIKAEGLEPGDVRLACERHEADWLEKE
jgi:hypothetical protein